MMIGVSACLAGIACRYDGKDQRNETLFKLVEAGRARSVCPEILGGLPIPRLSAEIEQGDGFWVWQDKTRVIDKNGTDVTTIYKEGALSAFKKLQEMKITTLILKEKSPSCGSHWIYDGSFSGTVKKGVGVATAYFILMGLHVYSDEEFEQLRISEKN